MARLGEGVASGSRRVGSPEDMHAWTQAEFLALILDCRRRFDGAFDIEAAARQGIEFVVVLRKQGPLPPAPPSAVGGGPAKRFLAKLRRRTRAALRQRRSR